MFPENRNRRLRKNSAIRAMVQENRLHPSDFIVPLFFMELFAFLDSDESFNVSNP